MTIELFVLSDERELDLDGMSRIRVGIGDGGRAVTDEPVTEDGRPQNLVFRALFKEGELATRWETRVKAQLEKAGVRIDDEYFFVSDAMVESLSDVAAHADDYEWLVQPRDDEFINMAMELGYARRRVEEAFDKWSACGRTPSAEIKINSYEQHVARNGRRLRDLQGKYVTPRFFNDGEKQNSQLDYAISKLKEDTRKWESEIRRLRSQIDASELAFVEWQAAVKRVNELEYAFADAAKAQRQRRKRSN